MEKNGLQKVGRVAFIVGVIIALIAGYVSTIIGAATTTSVLIVMGLIVGFLNVTEKETKDYLLAAVSIVIVTSLGGNVLAGVGGIVGTYLSSVLVAVMTFVLPAVIIVAIKAIYALAKD
jgi:hypothetical protein